MKRLLLVAVFFIIYTNFSFNTYGQIITSNGTGGGLWSAGATWIPNTPGGPNSANSSSIVISAGDVVNVDVNVSVDQTTVQNTATLNVNQGIALSVVDGTGTDLVINGAFNLLDFIGIIGSTLNVSGQIQNAGTIGLTSPPSAINFLPLSIYDHAVNGGVIPTANWDATSRLLITGTTTTAPTGFNQTFGHFEFNAAPTFVDLNIIGMTVLGDFDFTSAPSFVLINQTGSTTINIGGDMNISGTTNLVIAGAGNTVTLNVAGNVNSAVSSGSVTFSGSGATGIINLTGNFSHTSGSMSASGTGLINFIGSSSFTEGGSFTNIDFSIANGASLNLGSSFLSGSGDFTLVSGGTLQVGSSDGLTTGTTTGNMRVSGIRNYASNGNIEYNGGAAQDLGNEWGGSGALSGIAVNLIINNTNGVSNNIVGGTSVVGDLTLTAGPLNIGNSNSLDIQSNFNVTGGTIGGLTSSNLSFSGSGTMNSLSLEPGAQNLNNLTIDRSGTLILGSTATISGVLDLTGNLDFSSQTLTLNGTMTGTGGLISNASSDLIIGGSGAFGSIIYAGSGNQLNDLTFNRTSGTYSWNSSVTINNNVNLNFGTLTHASGLTMANDANFVRGAGSIISNAPIAIASYNVSYIGTDKTAGLELPSSASALNDLRVDASGTITLAAAVQVNGDLLLDGGTLNASTNNFTMAGANWTAGGGLFSINAANSTIFTGTTTMGGSSIGGTQLGSLTINGGAVLNAPAANINVSGVWSNSGTFNSGTGEVTFNGAGQSINTLGTVFNDVDILGTVTLSSALDVNGNLTISSSLDVSTGNHNINVGGTWDNNSGSFNPRLGTVIFDGANQSITSSAKPFHGLTVAGSGTTSLLDELTVNGDLTINGSSNLSVGIANNDIILAGDWISDGSFSAGLAKVVFSSSNVQDISGTSATSFNDIDITNGSTNGVRVQTDQNLTGTLTITDAATIFDADGTANTSVFTLISTDDDPATDGNIAALPTPANFTGNVRVQRYMSGEGGIYRYIAAPVSGLSVADWQSQFPITGSFTGADDLGGANDPSLYDYVEATAGTLDNGWRAYPLAINSETIDAGTGYAAFIRASAGTTIVNQSGPINKGSFGFGVSFTADAGAADDGWNLLGNPYPSALDWDALWTDVGTANVNATMSIKDNGGGGGVFATYNASTNTGTNGGTQYIAQGQAFWVQANAASPTLTASESMKSTEVHEFFRTSPPVDYLRVALSDGTYRDETLIHFFEDALPGIDKYDAFKLQNDIFNLSTLMEDGSDMVINALATIDCGSNLNLNITNIDEGDYSLSFTELNSFAEGIEVYLIDRYAGENIQVLNDQTYDFSVTADEESHGAGRFTLLLSEPSINTELAIQGSEVCEVQNAVVTIEQSELDVNYVLLNDGVVVSEIGIGTGGDLNIAVTGLPESNGEYSLDILGDSGCGGILLTTAAIVKVDGLYSVDQVEGAQACSSSSLALSATGAPADGSYRWYESESSAIPLEETMTGEFLTPNLESSTNYYVAIANSLGCEGARVIVQAEIIILEKPEIAIDTVDFRVYRLTSSYADGNQWFKNGEMINGANDQKLLITEPGIYSVEVTQASCTSFSDDFDGMNLVTAIDENGVKSGLQIFPNPVADRVTISVDANELKNSELLLKIINSDGKVVHQIDKFAINREYSVDVSVYASGIYLIIISDGELSVQQRLVKK